MFSAFITRLLAFFASSLGKYLLIGALSMAIGHFGIKLIGSWSDKISNHDRVVTELELKTQQLIKNDKDHAEEIARLESDRAEINDAQKKFRKAAYIEAGKLKQLLEESKSAKEFYNIPIDPDFMQLRIDRGTGGNEIRDELESPNSSARGTTN